MLAADHEAVGCVTAGTLDIMWSEPEPLIIAGGTVRCPAGSILWVVDYKSGDDSHTPPVEYNAQAKTNALMAAKYTGAEQVVPAILYIRKGRGEWDTAAEALGEVELAQHEEMLRSWIAQGREARANPHLLVLREGPHCGFCSARAHCPAHAQVLIGLSRALEELAGPDVAVSSDPAAVPFEPARVWVARRLRLLEDLVKKARAALIDQVDANGSIDVGDGLAWGPHPVKRTTILAKDAVLVLSDELGPHADIAIDVTPRITRETIREGVRAKLAADGAKRQTEATIRRIMAKLGEAGALVTEERMHYGLYRPGSKTSTEEE
ncbi:MAG: PD-(D/E)XK nuclease family protein [Acidobacteria bacterium Pan2503]|uniref:PD-(D/E)XK nuclease family protein n=1 Tax=Candidatus Acidiferrum panamense TaxID=2741543 RepID=A0A7V8NLH4_9BACT|nr:PD-(D/E)XK nuclease family protein [Candidatus Acidoferrum panamensis]